MARRRMTAKQRKYFGKRSKRSNPGGLMARRGRRGRSSGGSFGRGDFLSSALEGVGSAALMKRFVGAPLGTFTGVASGAGWAFVKKKNVLAAALGGYVHDNIGNVGGASSSGSGMQAY